MTRAGSRWIWRAARRRREAIADLRDGAEITEITHLVDLSAFPDGIRMIVRRERPHPGAQLSVFDSIEGLRHQVFITDSPRSSCSVQLLELRHRPHARVEDRIRAGKDTRLGRFPSRQFAINAAWLELALIAIDLLALTRTLLLDGEHTLAEPKKLRYRVLHVAARLVRTARRAILRGFGGAGPVLDSDAVNDHDPPGATPGPARWQAGCHA